MHSTEFRNDGSTIPYGFNIKPPPEYSSLFALSDLILHTQYKTFSEHEAAWDLDTGLNFR